MLELLNLSKKLLIQEIKENVFIQPLLEHRWKLIQMKVKICYNWLLYWKKNKNIIFWISFLLLTFNYLIKNLVLNDLLVSIV